MRAQDFDHSRKLTLLRKFTAWCRRRLALEHLPKIEFSNDFQHVQQHRTFGQASDSGPVWVYVGNRNTADIMRTLCHELIHARQFEQDLAKPGMNALTAQQVEDVANAWAGRLMREYGKKNPEIYEARVTPVNPNVAATLPAAFSITSLPNQDNYLQYRFGVAIASAKGAKQRAADDILPYTHEAEFGRNQVIVGFDDSTEHWILDAMRQVGLDPKTLHRVNSGTSHEPEFVKRQSRSPVNAFKGYARNKIKEAQEVHTGIKPSKSAEYAIPGAHRVGGTSDRFYDLLRIMMNVARSDGVNLEPMPQESWVGRNNVAIPYTAIEADMLRQAYAAAGVEWDDALKPNPDNKSQEHPAINKVSPVAAAAPDYRKTRR